MRLLTVFLDGAVDSGLEIDYGVDEPFFRCRRLPTCSEAARSAVAAAQISSATRPMNKCSIFIMPIGNMRRNLAQRTAGAAIVERDADDHCSELAAQAYQGV